MSDEQIGAAIRRAAETVHAPPGLRERVLAPAPARRPPRRRLVPRVAFGGALAAVLAAAVLLVAGGGPSVQDIAVAALRPPTAPVPAGGTGQPYAGAWQPVGVRVDRVGGRTSRTVVYRKGPVGAHYAILDGRPIDLPDGRRVGRFVTLRDHGAAIVAWQQDGHTCVLVSRLAGEDQLLSFAKTAWAEAGG